jgi:hypothetical protein
MTIVKSFRCGMCQSHGLVIFGWVTCKTPPRPYFRCTSCKHEWTCGSTGRGYTAVALRYMKKNGIPVPPVTQEAHT